MQVVANTLKGLRSAGFLQQAPNTLQTVQSFICGSAGLLEYFKFEY